MTLPLVIKPVTKYIIDVFWDKGWGNWARFEKRYFNGKLNLNLVKGSPMKKEQFHQLFELLEKPNE